MRHGITEMNVFLEDNPYNSRGFRDPLFYDTVLTSEGQEGAVAARDVTRTLGPEPELLVVSPLTRALHTAALAFDHYEGPIHVEPLARERVWLSSDVGSSPEELRAKFEQLAPGRYSFDHLPDIWWWDGKSGHPKYVELEPSDIFKARVAEFRKWLLARPEQCIAVVAHWGLLHELTGGASFDNCEVRSFLLVPTGKLQPVSKSRSRSDVFA